MFNLPAVAQRHPAGKNMKITPFLLSIKRTETTIDGGGNEKLEFLNFPTQQKIRSWNYPMWRDKREHRTGARTETTTQKDSLTRNDI